MAIVAIKPTVGRTSFKKRSATDWISDDDEQLTKRVL
jgi:hypothetical protein